LAGIAIPQLWRALPTARWVRAVSIPALLVLGYQFVAEPFKTSIGAAWSQYQNPKSLSFGQGIALLHRQMARTILDSAGGKPVVLLSSPNSSCILAALGGFRTVGTLYWENVAGLKAAAEGLNAQSDAAALAFIEKHGVTHVSLMNWENFIEPYFNILHPVPAAGVSVQNSFGKAALGDKRIPVWMRPLIFPPGELSKYLQQNILLLQVVHEQTLNEAKFHLARFTRLVEGKPDIAEATFKDILAAAPESSLVMIELANLYLEQHRYEEAVAQLFKALPDAKPEIRASLAGQVATELIKAGQWTLVAKVLRRTAEFADSSPQTLHNVAWVIATLPSPEARDPRFALSVCDRLEKMPHDVAVLALTRAASMAALGDFTVAVQLAQDVASGRIQANDERRRQATEMTASFQANKIWITAR
jgi:tetratricopeptide (TPR) repeat protein